MQHAGEDEVIGILRGTGGLSDSIFASNAVTDCRHFEKMRLCSSAGKALRAADETGFFGLWTKRLACDWLASWVCVMIVVGRRATIRCQWRTALWLDMCYTCKHVFHMAKMIQIRHVPDTLHRQLRVRAARAGMSLSDYLRIELEQSARRLSVDELREKLHALEPASVTDSPARALRRERGQ